MNDVYKLGGYWNPFTKRLERIIDGILFYKLVADPFKVQLKGT